MGKALWAVVAFVLASCAGMSRVGPGETVIRDTLAVKVDGGWNRLDAPGGGKIEVWTRDGLTLDTLRFIADVHEGEPLAEIRGVADKQLPRFRSAMQPREVVELFEALSVQGGNTFRLERLAPAQFLGGEGFRFDYTLLRKGDEVELRGFAYAAIRDKHLSLMVFQAPRMHYFGKHAAAVEEMVATARRIR